MEISFGRTMTKILLILSNLKISADLTNSSGHFSRPLKTKPTHAIEKSFTPLSLIIMVIPFMSISMPGLPPITMPIPGKSLLTKWWFDGWHLPPGIFRCQQGYILKTAVIFGEHLKVLKIFGKKKSKLGKKPKKKHTFLG
jgi:hypothetical protein